MGKKKEIINHEHERLWEELTLDRITKPAESPPMGGHGGSHPQWAGYTWQAAGIDIVYYNKEGQMHRIYGPAYVSKKFQIEKWFKNGELHRVGGPAISHKGTFLWYCEGELHNLEGPAVVEGGGPPQYWIHGARMTQKEFKKQIESRKRKGLIK